MTARLFIVISLMACTACGDASVDDGETPRVTQSSTATDAQDLEACTVVTREEVAAAIGAPVSQGEESGLVGCRWKAESGAQLSIQLFAGSTFSSGTCNGQKVLISGREEPVSGLGDEATWGTSGNLVVCSSRAVLKVDVDDTPSPPEKDREAAIAIARAALGRIR